ncbi:MAG TPA: endolytic transglycosylase MltG, partial [Ktedonobacterales bacterium]|nr:endolytic transglycosylase MltG [Ktedonobacterales bacterium]
MTRSPSSRPRTSSARKRTKKRSPAVVVLITVVLMIASFGCGFGALTVQADVMRPFASSAPKVTFIVNSGDSATSVIDRLAQQKFIRNATILKYYLKVTGANFKPAEGSHTISASMSPDQILQILGTPIPHIIVNIRVDDGSRLTEYADQIVASAADTNLNKTPAPLSNFSKQDFLDMVVNGNHLDQFTQKYWFLKPWTIPPAYAALEGYLYPNTYKVYSDDSTATIINKMLQAFGDELCPGADLSKMADCKSKQAIITMPSNGNNATVPGAGKTMGVFDALDKYYGANGTDYAGALQKALIIGSIAEHEARSPQHRALVASTYYNDWKDLTADSKGYL